MHLHIKKKLRKKTKKTGGPVTHSLMTEKEREKSETEIRDRGRPIPISDHHSILSNEDNFFLNVLYLQIILSHSLYISDKQKRKVTKVFFSFSSLGL